MSIKKDRYEISLWEDYIVSAQGEGENLVPEHYEERKIAVIGSDTMTAQWRAIEPKLVSNINGTNTFTFKMYYKFINNETGEKEDNPIISLLVNERKIKCLWKNKWYDLVIKSCQEDSSGKSITYTCKDLFINELSKTGFDLEFDTELENNQGTVTELGTKILDGTDWQLGESDIIKQYKEEPVYEVETLINFVSNEEVVIKKGKKILVYYSVFNNKSSFFQFWYDESQLFVKDKSSMLVNSGECLSTDVTWSKVKYNGEDSWQINIGEYIIGYISESALVSEEYRAKRLIRSQNQILDPLTDKYVYEYFRKDNGKKVYGYTETKYDDVITINNYITNSKDFSSTTGWSGSGINFELYPLFTIDIDTDYEAKSYLSIPALTTVYNSGIKDFRSYIENGFTIGEKYIFRVKAMYLGADEREYCDDTNINIIPHICKYSFDTENDKYIKDDSEYFNISSKSINGDWIEYELNCIKSATYNELLRVGLFIENTNSSDIRWIENIQFFKYATGTPVIQEYNSDKTFIEDDVILYNSNYYICIRNSNNNLPTNTNYWNNLGETQPTIRINPGSYSAQSYANIIWKFYEAGQSVLNVDDLVYLYSGDEISAKQYIFDNLTPIYNDNYEKIRSITGKNSNRFNLLQSLAETFECWIKFEIEHDENTGRIKYINGKPQKWVKFVNDIGIETGIGFIYGIDLKTISRTINSDSITSKVIVTANNNEYGKDGFCTIARSPENYSRANFILNFDYYISQGLLSAGKVNADLYSSVKDAGIGYYYWLNNYNLNYDSITELLKEKNTELTKQESLQKTYLSLIDETNEEITSVESELASLAGYIVFKEKKVYKYLVENPDFTKVNNLWITRKNLKNSLNQYSAQLNNLNISVNNLKTYTDNLLEQQKDYIDKIEELDKEFYNKYSRFLQEGSWTSDDYYDDNLYYLDALSVAYTSSRPQISYNISVLRLSALEEYKNKIFNLGDISFIQDTEFFGYTTINGVKTPYKEKVLVSEITSNFDSPEKDSFKVQNYKTQFEDLFQRITATTQNLQYTTGAYNKAADSFTATGEIIEETLQRSFELNQNLAWAARDDSVTYDTTGVTVIDTSNPNRIVRLSSKGLQISEDGGEHWYLGITGSGISTKYLTSGIITTDKINIMDGSYPTFRWDKYGLSAFAYELEDEIISNVNNANFVRFDRFGLYGIDTVLSENWKPENEDKIWETAKFGLTWKGFFMKNKYGDGYVSISSTDDFIVHDGNNTRIKIGNIGTISNPVYGLFITDGNGNKVMETNSDGTLWLKNRLNVETNDDYSVGIGKLGAAIEGGKNEVINANNKFVVYEDGSIKATDGEFTGIINATGGTIGGMSISTVVSNSKKVEIISDNGFIFSSDTPASITLTANLINATGALKYQWYKDGELISGQTGNSLIINNSSINLNSSSIYKVVITETADGVESEYYNFSTIQKIFIPDSESTYYELVSNQDYVQKTYIRNDSGNLELHFSPNIINIIAKEITKTNQIELNPDNYKIKFSYLNEEEWIEIDTSDNELKQYIKTNDKGWEIYIENLAQTDQFKYENLNNLRKLLINKDTVIKCEFSLPTSPILYTKTIQISYNISDAIAKLSLNAYDIVASIESTSLTFNINGLTVNNGGLIIKKDSGTEAEETLLQYDAEKESLYIKGNGEFTGTIKATDGEFTGIIYATDGEFNGTIKANNGSIGGFIINENSLISIDGNIQLINNESGNSKIIVKTIELGEGAVISNYIKLGNSYIYNPKDESNLFIEVTDGSGNSYISIKNNGIATFGNITIDGTNSIISGNNFRIAPERSEFSNVDITGTIHSSVFETGKTQSVGGSMLFRESAEIQSCVKNDDNTYTIITQTEIKLDKQSLVLLSDIVDIYGEIIEIIKDKFIYKIKINSDKSLIEPKIIIHLADYDSKNNKYINNLLIGINSQNSPNMNLFENAITFRDFDSIKESTGNTNYEPNYNKPKLLLGDLSSLGDINIKGYGLYGDNVYLKGSLTTQVSDTSYAASYAGINTLSGATATKFADDNSKIIFWAGSKGTNVENIQASLFQVTEAGSLYAQKGLFEGSIITNSIIQASDLYAIRLYGGTETKTAALNIYDTAQGIVFKTREIDEQIEEETLRLNASGFSINEGKSYFVKIEDDKIFFNGEEVSATSIIAGSTDSNYLKLSNNLIESYQKIDSDAKLLGYLKWDLNKYSIYIDENNNISQDNNQILLSTNLVKLNNNVSFDDKMKYEKTDNGYNLYISD